jgi:hypothetical protein
LCEIAAIRILTTEGTEYTEAGEEGVLRIRTLSSSVFSVFSVVQFFLSLCAEWSMASAL